MLEMVTDWVLNNRIGPLQSFLTLDPWSPSDCELCSGKPRFLQATLHCSVSIEQ